jgi:hypothetical protein
MSSDVRPYGAEVVHSLTSREARALTDQVKADAAALWAKLLRLYEGGAHTALGYSSWGAYYEAEFGQLARTGKRLLEAARNVEAVGDTRVPPTQNAARELTPLRDDPEELRQAWDDVVDEYPEPPAKQVRKAVSARRSPPAQSNGGPTPLLVSTLEGALRCLTDAARYASNLAEADIPPEVRRNYWAARELLDQLDVALRQLFAEDDD